MPTIQPEASPWIVAKDHLPILRDGGAACTAQGSADFAHRRVEVFVNWSPAEVSIAISDDGPGFAPEVIDRIGAPYVTHRRPEPRGEGEDTTVFGLGLGFFIAKTLLERSGAKLSLTNQAPPMHGATIAITWSRAAFERALIAPPLEPAAEAS